MRPSFALLRGPLGHRNEFRTRAAKRPVLCATCCTGTLAKESGTSYELLRAADRLPKADRPAGCRVQFLGSPRGRRDSLAASRNVRRCSLRAQGEAGDGVSVCGGGAANRARSRDTRSRKLGVTCNRGDFRADREEDLRWLPSATHQKALLGTWLHPAAHGHGSGCLHRIGSTAPLRNGARACARKLKASSAPTQSQLPRHTFTP